MKKSSAHTFTVKNLDRPSRLDRVLREQVEGIGRRASQSLINAKKVRVNDKVVWICSWKVKNGDRVQVDAEIEKPEAPLEKFDKAWLIRRDSDVIAVNKPAGLLSHKTRATGHGDMLAMASEYFGPVFLFHRLDRDTSGVMLFTHNGPINRYLDTAFKEGSILKEYLACVAAPNKLEASGTIRARMRSHPQRRERMIADPTGRRAVTRYEVIAESDDRQLVRLWPETGRTHQLRVHMAFMNAPIIGDRLYAPRQLKAPRMLLHARAITLPEQDGFPERSFSAPVSDDFLAILPEELKAALQSLA